MTDKIVTLPLSPTDMVEFFQDKTQAYLVDLDETMKSLDERSILLYLANLKIKASFTKVTHKLLKEYMSLKDFVDVPMLTAVHANVLSYVKYGEIFFEEATELFSVDDITTFAKDNVDVVADQCVFLDSFFLYIVTRELKEDEEVTQTELFDNDLHDTLGFTLISLITYQDFMIMYMRSMPDLDHQTYYSRYFDDYMFKGKNLFHYVHSSLYFGLAALIRKVLDGTATENDIACLNAIGGPTGVEDEQE